MRIALFVVVGLVVGVVLARRGEDKSSVGDAAPARSRQQPVARVTWTSPMPMGHVLQRELPATDPRYDAVQLSKENEELSTKEIFDSEPRDPAFAPILEKRMHATLSTAFRELQLEDSIDAVKTECKTLSCYTRIEVSKENGWRVYDSLNGVMMGDVQEPQIDESDPEHTYVTLGNLYRASARDEAAFEEFQSAATWPSLEAAKQRLAESRDEAPR